MNSLLTAHRLLMARSALVACCLLSFAAPLSGGDMGKSRPVPLIFDTDIGNDVDDALALAMVHSLQTRRECRLLAVTITKDHPQAASFTDAINTFYGRGNVRIGVCRNGVTPAKGKFIGLATTRDGGQLRFPHDLVDGNKAPDAVAVLRQALAGQEDHQVVLVQVGFSSNLAKLLKSPPDDISPLSGRDLVKKKTRLLSIMAGVFGPGPGGRLKTHREYNVVKDIKAAQELARGWPTEIVWSGFEVGLSLPFPHQSIERDYRYVDHHPIADAYRAYSPPPHDRPTWDLTSVLYAVRPDHGYFGVSGPGTVRVTADGQTLFSPDENGNQRFLTVTPQQRIRVLEALVQLSSQPPK